MPRAGRATPFTFLKDEKAHVPSTSDRPGRARSRPETHSHRPAAGCLPATLRLRPHAVGADPTVSAHRTGTGADAGGGKRVFHVYLAGPEVFLPEPAAVGERKKARIAAISREACWPFELAGLYPLDNGIADLRGDFETGMRIFRANVDLMNRAHAVAANMVRFRGPSMDVGTAFEMGYVLGLGKPVFAYYDAAPFYGREESPGTYVDRVRRFCSVPAHDDCRVDADGLFVDDFGMADNLMMIGALESGAGSIAGSFDEAIMQIARYLRAVHPVQRPLRREDAGAGRAQEGRGESPRRAE